jgi:aspartyl-tRNA synthetase
MSFVEQDDVFDVVENFLVDMTKELSDKEIITKTP